MVGDVSQDFPALRSLAESSHVPVLFQALPTTPLSSEFSAIRNLMFQALCESRIAGVNCLGSKARGVGKLFPLSAPKASQAMVGNAPGSMSRGPNLLG